jgi:hypothetical protein
MKTCSKCKIEKPHEDFHTRGNGVRRGVCKKCWNAAAKGWKKSDFDAKGWRMQRRMFIVDYFQRNPCVDCGEKNPIVLEFDHVPERGQKSFEISGGMKGQPMKRLLVEMSKCEVRCANCHRKKTAARNPSHWCHIFMEGSQAVEPPVSVLMKPGMLQVHHEAVKIKNKNSVPWLL